MNKYLQVFMSMFAPLIFASIARAEYSYVIRFDQANVAVMPGQSFNVNVLLEETISGMSQHRLDLPGGSFGLLSGSFGVSRSGAGTSQVTSASGNPLYDLGPIVTLGNPTTVSQASLLNPPVFGSASGMNMRSVTLGTLSITGNGSIGDTNLFLPFDFNLGSDDFVIDDGFGGLSYVADGTIVFQGLNVALTAVPEPSSLGTTMLLAWGLVFHRRRRQTP